MRTYRSGAVKAPLTPALSLADGERIRRKEISRFNSLNRNGKRQRTGAVQDANAPSGTPRARGSVVECASPLALSHRLTGARFIRRVSARTGEGFSALSSGSHVGDESKQPGL